MLIIFYRRLTLKPVLDYDSHLPAKKKHVRLGSMRMLNALWLSFYSRPLYKEVFTQWRGVGFIYLLLLALVQTIVSTSQMDAQLKLSIRDYAPSLVSQIPAVTIKNGVASTPEPKAYEVINPQTQKRLALINTALDKAPTDLGDTPIFLGKTAFQTFKPDGKMQEIDFKTIDSLKVEQADLLKILKFVANWGAYVLAPFMFILQTAVLMFEVIFFSLFAWISLRMMEPKVPYKTILRLTAVALTPATIFSIIFNTFLPADSFSSFFYVLFAVGYISFAVYAIKNEWLFLS